MKILNIYKYILAALLLWSVFSCTKDRGNYDYQNNEFMIIEDIPAKFLQYKSLLTVAPVIKDDAGSLISLQDTNYSFTWFIEKADFGSPMIIGGDATLKMEGVVKQYTTTAGRKYSLNFGEYLARFRITNKKNGYFSDKTFSLTFANETYKGWLLLNETAEGQSRLDMVSTVDGDANPVQIDVLTKVGSKFPTTGKPEFIQYAKLSAFNGLMRVNEGIQIGTSTLSSALQVDTFSYLSSYNLQSTFSGSVKPTNFTDVRYYPTMDYNSVILANGQVFTSYYISSSATVRYFGPVKNESDQEVNAAPYVAIPFNYSESDNVNGFNYIVYDRSNRKFLRVPRTNETKALALPNGNLFKFDDPAMDLVYMQFSVFGSGEVAAVLKNNTNERFFAKFSTSGSQIAFKKINGEGITQTQLFAVDPSFGYLFYAVGGKLYEYDYQLDQSFLMQDFGTDVISYIGYNNFASDAEQYKELKKKLLVATYNPRNFNTGGAFLVYDVPGLNRNIAEKQKYAGFAKIVSLTYRER